MSILVEYFEYFGEKEPKILIEFFTKPFTFTKPYGREWDWEAHVQFCAI